MEYERLNQELSVVNLGSDKLTVKLSDGSEWRVKEGDISMVVSWYVSQRVVVSKNGSEVYPYLLTNLDTAGPDKVEACIR